MRSASLSIAVLGLLLLAAPLALGAERYSVNGHYYEYVTTSVTWASAKSAAEKKTYSGMEGHLATLTSSGENEFVRVSVLPSSSAYWIGGYQDSGSREPNYDWKWITEEKWSFTNWNSGEPNDSGGEDVAEIYGGNGYWNDNKVTGTRGYLIEYEPVAEIEINGGDAWTGSTSVTLGLTFESGDDAGVPDVRFRNAGGTWSDWQEYETTVSWTLEGGDGEKTVEAEFRDDYGLVYQSDAKILLDRTAPTGSLVIQDGAGWVNDLHVDVTLNWSDSGSGVTHVRLRNSGEAWGSWFAAVTRTSWDLLADGEQKTVEAEYRDAAGNVSDIASDTVGLDLVPPEVTVALGGTGEYLASRSTTIYLDATDVGSGVADMRIRRATTGTSAEWEDWVEYQATYPWTVIYGDGLKRIEAQVRDLAGNVSAVVSDQANLDGTAPECTSFRVNAGQPYTLPGEEIVFEVYGSDGLDGSGVDGFKATFDNGGTWTDWYSLQGGYLTKVARPEVEGLVVARVVLRDAVGNESAPAEAPCYLVETEPPLATGGGKLAADLAPAADVDTFAVDLAKDDALTVKLKAKASEKGRTLVCTTDLFGPDAAHTGLEKYQGGLEGGFASFVAPESGRYLVVTYRDPTSTADGGALSFAVKVKQAKTNKKMKGTSAGPDLGFEAVAGSTVKISLKGEGLTAAQVTLTGPDGEVGFASKEKKGKVTILPTVLDAGSGTYTLHLDTGAEVSYAIKVKLPKKVKGAIPD